MTDTLALLAATWGIFMGLSPLLQIRRMLETRSSDDVSVSYFVVLLVGFVLWVAYGIALGNVALIIPNFVAFTIGITTIVVALRFRRVEG